MRLVDYLVARDGPPAPSGLAYDYVVAADGLWVQAENGHLAARVPVAHCEVRGLAALHPVFTLKHGRVPDALAHEAGGNRYRMNGTERHPVRCVALADLGNGCIGCGIYDQRPQPCRDFPFASYGCHDTRAKLGLPPLTDGDTQEWPQAA